MSATTMRMEVVLDSLSEVRGAAPSRPALPRRPAPASLGAPVGERRLELARHEGRDRLLAGGRDLPGDLLGLRELERRGRDLAGLVGGLDEGREGEVGAGLQRDAARLDEERRRQLRRRQRLRVEVVLRSGRATPGSAAVDWSRQLRPRSAFSRSPTTFCGS